MVAGRANAAIVALAFAVACVPIIAVAFPPVMDFPNHLARIWLLSGAAERPPLSSFYVVNWAQAATNIAVDFAAAQLARVLPIFAVSKLLLLAMFLGPPAGAVLLNRALYRGFHPWQLAPLALAWTTTAIAGFMSYQISLAVALVFAALAARRNPVGWLRGFLFHLLACSLLLPIHLWGVLFYLTLSTGLALGERIDLRRPRGELWAIAGRMVLLGLAGLVPVFALLILSPHPPGANNAQHAGVVWSGLHPRLGFDEAVAKAIDHFGTMILSPILSYDLLADVLLAAPVVALFGWAAWTRRLRVHWGLAVVAAALLVLALVAPRSIGDAGWIQRRLPLMAALTILAATRPVLATRRAHAAVAALLLVTTFARTAWIGAIWTARQSDVRALFAAGEALEPGAAVLVLQQTPRDWHRAPIGRMIIGGPSPNPVERHFASLLVIRNRVFIPTLFATVGQQPLGVTPAWRDKSMSSSAVPAVADLGTVSRNDPYVRHWRRDFDYVLVIDADETTDAALPRDGLRAISGSGPMRLFRIVRAAGVADSPRRPIILMYNQPNEETKRW